MEDEIQNLSSEGNAKNNSRNIENIEVGLPPELPSHEENKEKLIQILHKGGLLPNLRTYHGDIAEFIKSKDQSLTSIALRQNEKEQEQKEKVKNEARKDGGGGGEKGVTLGESDEKPRNFSDLPTNFLIYVISICLLVGTIAAGAYLLLFNQNQNPILVSEEKKILPVKKTVILDIREATRSGLKDTFESLRNSPDYRNGITGILISDSSKKIDITLGYLADMLKWNIPSALRRSLNEEFMLGLYDDDAVPSFFLILKVRDYGIAFRDMLEWEGIIQSDLDPFLKSSGSATSTASATSTSLMQASSPQAQYLFKDLIVRNKDTRAALSSIGRVRLLYTFLDKETILITESENAIKGLLDAYVAGNTVR